MFLAWTSVSALQRIVVNNIPQISKRIHFQIPCKQVVMIVFLDDLSLKWRFDRSSLELRIPPKSQPRKVSSTTKDISLCTPPHSNGAYLAATSHEHK